MSQFCFILYTHIFVDYPVVRQLFPSRIAYLFLHVVIGSSYFKAMDIFNSLV